MSKPKYFEYFPEVEVSRSGTTKLVKDLNRYLRISPDIILSKYAHYDYVIKDGERPDHVAYKHYGNSKYYWIILVTNNIRDIWREWPLTRDELDAYAIDKYGSLSTANSCVHHYITTDGVVIDETTANSIQSTEYESISCYQYEDMINESKRFIKIIQPRFITQFAGEIETVFEDSQ